MDFEFIPEKLILAKEQVQLQHGLKSHSDIMSCSRFDILAAVKGFDFYHLKKFIHNILSELSYEELEEYPDTAFYLRSMLGSRRSERFNAIFSDEDEYIVQKFLDWINICKIDQFFANDERSRFWKKYRFINVLRYSFSDTVLMEFKDHIAVEFLGMDPGTIYICDKATFKRVFYDKLNELDNDHIRLYFSKNRSQCLERKSHSGNWRSSLSSTLEKKAIAERIQ